MMPSNVRRRRLRGAVLTAAMSLALAAAAHAQVRNFDLPAQPLSQSLQALGQQADLQIVFTEALVRGLEAPALKGGFTAEEALQRLLEGTGLKAERTPSGAVMIVREAAETATTLGQITVTATRRDESIQKVPMSISALGEEEIARRNLRSQNDFLRTIPGVNQIEQGAGGSSIVMRGIAVSPTADGYSLGLTTAVFLGETPLSAGRVGQTDLRLVDIERVEVLRGPQGTAYGSGAISGALRYIPNAPDLNEIEGSVKMGYSRVGGAGGNGHNLEGTVNLPLVDDRLALRTSVYRHRDASYIRNIAASHPQMIAAATERGIVDLLGEGPSGGNQVSGGRATLRWVPSDRLDTTLTFMKQKMYQEGDLVVQVRDSANGYYPAAGDFYQTRYLYTNTFGGGQRRHDNAEIGNFLLRYDLGWAELTGSVSHSDQSFLATSDLGELESDGNPYPQLFDQVSKARVGELRLTSRLDGPLSFIFGLYYEDTSRRRIGDNRFGGTLESLQALYPEAGSDRSVGRFDLTQDVTQKAAYGELAYDFGAGLKATVGGRTFRYETESVDILDGIWFGGYSRDRLSATDSGQVYKASLSYEPSRDALLYASWSQGFRLGFTQPPLPLSCDADRDGYVDEFPGVPLGVTLVEPDRLDNYELGGKFTLLDSRMSLSATAFSIDWEGLPVRAFPPCNVALLVNAGKARSRGIELETRVALARGLELTLGGSYVNAELAADSGDLGSRGDRLPGAPRVNGRLALDYSFALAGRGTYVQAEVGYVGGFYGWIGADRPDAQGEVASELGDYTTLGIRGGMQFGAVGVQLYADNVTDRRALAWGDPTSGMVLRPRTFGINLSYEF